MIKKLIHMFSVIIYFLMFSCSEKDKSVVAIEISGTYIFSLAPPWCGCCARECGGLIRAIK
jgi:hypothetical protein